MQGIVLRLGCLDLSMKISISRSLIRVLLTLNTFGLETFHTSFNCNTSERCSVRTSYHSSPPAPVFPQERCNISDPLPPLSYHPLPGMTHLGWNASKQPLWTKEGHRKESLGEETCPERTECFHKGMKMAVSITNSFHIPLSHTRQKAISGNRLDANTAQTGSFSKDNCKWKIIRQLSPCHLLKRLGRWPGDQPAVIVHGVWGSLIRLPLPHFKRFCKQIEILYRHNPTLRNEMAVP